MAQEVISGSRWQRLATKNFAPPSVWPHLFCGAHDNPLSPLAFSANLLASLSSIAILISPTFPFAWKIFVLVVRSCRAGAMS
jgi:hypothetical protein